MIWTCVIPGMHEFLVTKERIPFALVTRVAANDWFVDFLIPDILKKYGEDDCRFSSVHGAKRFVENAYV